MNVPSGYTALDLIGFTDQGDYDSSANYVKNDLVHYNNTVWRCLIDDTTNVTPVEGANWTVFIQNGTTLAGMADVNLTTPSNADVLQYNSTSSKWENHSVDSTPTQSSFHPVQSGGVYTQLANKANTADLATVATTGAYADLSGTPSLATVATTGQYSDLSGTPSIPTVNDGTLTIQKNGTNVATFSANQSGNQTADISVPTKTSDLTNDSNFVSDANYQHITVDSALSDSSTNPVQNQAITNAHNALKTAYTDNVNNNGCKNLIYPGEIKQTGNTVTFTPNADKSITISNTGATTGDAYYNSSGYNDAVKFLLKKGKYILSYGDAEQPLLSDMGISAFYLWDYTLRANGCYINATSGEREKVFTVNSDRYFKLCIWIASGKTPSGTLYPMIRLASDDDDTWQSPTKTNRQLTEDSPTWTDESVIGAVNYCKNNAITQTITDGTNTFTVTVNDDKSVSISADSYPITTEGFLFDIWTNVPESDCKNLLGKQMKLTGCPTGGSSDSFRLQAYRVGTANGSSGTYYDHGDGAVFTWLNNASGTKAIIRVWIVAGYTMTDPLTFKPMLSPVSYNGPYVPYADTNKGLTDKVTDLVERVYLMKEVMTSISKNTSKTITFSASDRFILTITHAEQSNYSYMGIGGASATGCSLLNITSVPTGIALAQSANTITITNNSSYTLNVAMIDFAGKATIS